MNIYFRIGWLSLVSLLLFEVLAASFFGLKGNMSIFAIFVLISLPLINILIQEIKKDFFSLDLGMDGTASIKWTLLLLAGIMAHYYGFTLLNSLVGLYFVFSVLFVFESRVSFLIAFVFLVFCPILIITSNQALAETFAIMAYYFLCIGVVTQILEFRFHKNLSHDE